MNVQMVKNYFSRKFNLWIFFFKYIIFAQKIDFIWMWYSLGEKRRGKNRK